MALHRVARRGLAVLGAWALGACAGEAGPEQRTALLKELIRARTLAREPLPLDGCSVVRFLPDVPAWRDSLDAEERTRVVDGAPCAVEPVARAGRWTLVRWYRNPGGEYVIRGTAPGGDDEYTFDNGVIAGHRRLAEGEFAAGAASAAQVRVESATEAAPAPAPDAAGGAAPPGAATPAAPRDSLAAESSGTRTLADVLRRGIAARAASARPTSGDARVGQGRRDSASRDSVWRDSITRAAVADETRRRDSLRRIVEERTRRQRDSMSRASSEGRPPRR